MANNESLTRAASPSSTHALTDRHMNSSSQLKEADTTADQGETVNACESTTTKQPDTTTKPKKHTKRGNSKSSNMAKIVEQRVDDLFQMCRPERQYLLEGPTFTLRMRDTLMGKLPKRLAMAASPVLNALITSNASASEYKIESPNHNPQAILYLLRDWIKNTKNDFELDIMPFQSTFQLDVAILRTAYVLGMQAYTRHILGCHIDYLKTQLATYKEMSAVIEYRSSDKDPLYTTMVNKLCHLRYRGLIPDPNAFELYLDKNPCLRKSMDDADTFFRNRAQAYNQERAEQWRIEAEQRRVAEENFHKKLQAQGYVPSGVQTMSIDEAQWMRRGA